MIVHTKSGSIYELEFYNSLNRYGEGRFRRTVRTQGKERDFDLNWVEFSWCSVDPFKAPEQIIGCNMRIRLKTVWDPNKAYVSTNIVTDIES